MLEERRFKARRYRQTSCSNVQKKQNPCHSSQNREARQTVLFW